MGVKAFDRANPTVKQIEVYEDFSGGLNTELADNMTRDNQFRELVNFDLDQAGTLKKRPGLYEIPGVSELIRKKIQDAFADQPEEAASLKIIDCIEFYDGLHWVFNYITNKGLLSLILSDKMKIIPPSSASNPFEYVLFYRNILNNIKISPYNDYYICITSLYTDTSLGVDDTKQVTLFSWNPIPKILLTDGTYLTKGWVEASSVADIVEDTFYGNVQNISKPTLGTFDVFDEFNSKKIMDIREKYETLHGSALKNSNLTCEYVKGTPVSFFKFTWDAFDGKKEKKIPLDVDGGLSDAEIDQLYIRHDIEALGYKTYVSAVSKSRKLDINIIIDIQSLGGAGDDSEPNLVFSIQKNLSPIPFVGIYGNPTPTTRARNFHQFESREGRLLLYEPYKFPVRENFEVACGGIKDFENDSTIPPKKYADDSARGRQYSYKEGKFLAYSSNQNVYCTTSPGGSNAYDTSSLKSSKFDNPDYTSKFVGDFFTDPKSTSPTAWYQVMNRSGTTNEAVTYFGLSELGMKNIPKGAYTTRERPGFFPTPESFKGDVLFYNLGIGTSLNYKHMAYSPFQTDRIMPRRHKYLNENTTLFAHAEAVIDLESSGIATSLDVHTGGLINNELKFYIPSIKNLPKIVELDTSIAQQLQNVVGIDAWDLFDKEEMQKLYDLIIEGSAFNVSLVWLYNTQLNNSGQTLTIESTLRADEISDLINYLINTPNPVLIFKSILLGSRNIVNYYTLQVFANDKLILDVKDIVIESSPVELNIIIKTLKLFTNYSYYPEGLVDRVVSFKQMKYIKPNLNDLNYLWYNLVLFNKYKQTTNPDIFDSNLYKYISPDLIEYPTSSVISTAPINLYGIVPVNNVILQPGDDQMFQIFFNVRKDGDKRPFENLTCHLEAMSAEDYNSKITAQDFDTVKSLDWVMWDTMFNDIENSKIPMDYKERTVLKKISIPSTTTAFVVILQVGQRVDKPDENDATADEKEAYEKNKPKPETLTRTTINMYPQASATNKISSVALFDEFTVSKNLVPYNTALVAYGDSNKLFLSDIAVPSYFPLSSVLQLKTPEKITSARMFQNKLIVSTENSRHYLSGSSFDADNPEDRYSIKEIATDSGVWAPKSDIPFGDKMFFLDQTGIKALKNLYGTTDKEFTYDNIDSIIKKVIPQDITQNNKLANAVSFNGKYYLNFPESNIILIFNSSYTSWTLYESNLMKFTKMFVNNGELFGIHRTNFNIYRFDEKVLVDGWNEDKGYEIIKSKDGAIFEVQKGERIVCRFTTKNLNQNYVPHRKKYDWALLNASVTGASAPIIPTVLIDGENVLNYESVIIDDNGELMYQQVDSEEIFVRNDAKLGFSSIIDMSRLGKNEKAFYNVPIRRAGNTIAFKFKYDAVSTLAINSLSIRFSLKTPRRNRKGIS